jgi:integrase
MIGPSSVSKEGTKMAGTVREAALGSRTARSRLKRGRQPHFNSLVGAKVHLGYVRREGERAGRWILRRRIGGKYSTTTIGAAADAIESDGVGTLSCDEARERALELANAPRVAGSPTVGAVFDAYVKDLVARGKNNTVARTTSIYLADLADVRVDELTTSQLTMWLASVAAVSIRSGAPADDEAARRRQNSANRVCGVLLAALNHAYREGRVASDAAWRRVRKFRGVDQPRTRYLSIAECARLLNACDLDFRNLVRAALSTGCRFSELARLEVADLDLDAGTIHVRRSKSGYARFVPLNDEALAFFRPLAAGRAGGETLLTHATGEAWRGGTQKRPMAAACERARIVPAIGFHTLRHTFASHAVMSGAPLPVVAVALGHVDTRMTQRYAHLARSYVGDEIRRAAPRFGVEPAGNVEPFKIKRDR